MLAVVTNTNSRSEFTTFKSNVCHLVKDMGDISFLIDALENDAVGKLWSKGWDLEALYLLAMVDYLSRENDVALCDKYDYQRTARFEETVYPGDINMLSMLLGHDKYKERAFKNAIPEFLRFNIVESEVRNVY